MSQHKNQAVTLMTPSWLSGTFAVIGAVLLIAVGYFKARLSSGVLGEGLQGLQTISGPPYHQLTDSLAKNSLASNLPLLLVWAAVGAAVYLIAVRVFKAFSNAASLAQTVSYTNVKRDSFLRSIAISYGLRIAALFSWFIYWTLFLKVILPAVTATGHSVAQMLLFGLGLTLAFHIHILFIRLILLRPRVFSD